MSGSWVDAPIEVVWEGGKRYRGGPAGGPTLVLDGDTDAAPGPVQTMVVALAACSAIDVVEILEKRRTPVTRLETRVEYARADSPPRRITAARVHFVVETRSEPHHVERAAELSFGKYCSVSSSLAGDVELTWTVQVEAPGEPAGGA